MVSGIEFHMFPPYTLVEDALPLELHRKVQGPIVWNSLNFKLREISHLSRLFKDSLLSVYY